ncbi:MAG: hypothetical protein FWD12_04405 [Alphaproteobacteria bacterium]|nr:hypothetical protein [Alphaproteobacteria bacterium]
MSDRARLASKLAGEMAGYDRIPHDDRQPMVEHATAIAKQVTELAPQHPARNLVLSLVVHNLLAVIAES